MCVCIQFELLCWCTCDTVVIDNEVQGAALAAAKVVGVAAVGVKARHAVGFGVAAGSNGSGQGVFAQRKHPKKHWQLARQVAPPLATSVCSLAGSDCTHKASG